MFGILKGWLGEKAAQFGMWMGLNGEVYRRIHNLVLPSQGGTTQIDHVLVSVYGIFVVETKNMQGWIFGDEHSSHWTQSIYGKKSRFQNPLRQNYRHVRAVAEFLGIPDNVIHPVVFFIGDCEIKTSVPRNVLTHGLCNYVRSFREQVFSPERAGEILARLSQAKAIPAASHALHVANLQERHRGSTCPKCGGSLVTRTAKQGPNAGRSFLGCSGFPKCRYTRAG